MPQQDLLRVMNAPQLYVGQEARFGGKVVKVTNTDGRTRLEIATQPLDESARPRLGAASVGRIWADVNGFIDPVDVTNQMVTVVGTIKGSEKGQGQLYLYRSGCHRLPALARTAAGHYADAADRSWIWYGPTRHHPGYWGPNPGWVITIPVPRRCRRFSPNKRGGRC